MRPKLSWVSVSVSVEMSWGWVEVEWDWVGVGLELTWVKVKFKSGWSSKPVLRSTYVDEQLLFSMFPSILTFEFDLIFVP